MKTGLLAVSALVLLLLGSLFWISRSKPAPESPEPRVDAPAARQAPFEGLSTEARREDEPAAPSSATAPRTPAAGAERQPQEPESALPPLADLASSDAGASIEATRAAEYESFATKYKSSSAADRRLARQTIESMLLAHKRGTEDKSQSLSKDQVLALGHEIEWLEANPAP